MKQELRQVNLNLLGIIDSHKVLTFFAIVISILSVSMAKASALSTFTNHVWKFADASATNTIDFNKGASKVYDNGNLHIATDDNIYLDAPSQVTVQNKLQVGGQLKFVNGSTHTYTGTRMYDNGQLHITTDDHLYLDAPSDVNVSNTLNVGASSSIYTGTTNRNCNEACIDMTPPDDGGSNAVFEYQGDGGGAPESSGIALNSDQVNIWSPGDDGLANFFDEDSFCTDCTIGSVGSGADVEAVLTIDDFGGIWANGDSTFYGDLTVEGDLTAAGLIDWTEITGVSGDFQVGTGEGGGDLNVYGDTFSNNITSYGDVVVGNDCEGCVLELQNYGYTQFDYSGGNWQWYVNSSDFTMYNSELDADVLSVNTSGELTANYDMTIGCNGECNQAGLTVNGDVTLGVDSNNSITLNGRLYGNDGGPVTVGHYSDESYGGFKVWGNTDLRGDTLIGGWGMDWSDSALQVLNPDGGRVFNVNTDANRVSVGHWDTSTDLKVWGDTDLEGDLVLSGDGVVYNNEGAVTVADDMTIDSGTWDFNAFQILNPDGARVFNVNTDYNRVSVGHWDTGTELKVWGDSDLLGYVTLRDGGEAWDDINIYDGGNLNINDGGNLYVDGTATVNDLIVNNSQTFNGTVAYGGNVTFNGNSIFNGNATYNGGLTAGSATLTGALVGTSATFSNTLTANSGVNFAGAAYTRIPVRSVGETCDSGSKGSIYYDSDDNHYYGCNGSTYVQLDN